MGTISSGVGLVSGMDIQGIVSQLMEIEARQRDQVVERKEELTAEQTALMEMQALVMAVQISASGFNEDSIFQQKAITNSNEDILTALADQYAPTGQYQFVVKQMAANHNFVSHGYSTLNSAIGTGTLSFEIGQGQLLNPTDLNLINGRQGFQRGTIEITDQAGQTAEIDLRMALTVEDVIDEINRTENIDVTASVAGDSITLTDTSGGGGSLTVSDIGTGQTAYDLGIRNDAAESVTAGKITGRDLIYITNDTLLADLNDGSGIRDMDDYGTDIVFTATNSDEVNIDFRSTMTDTVNDDPSSTTLKSLNRGAGVREGTFRITDQNGKFIDIDTSVLDPDATLGELRTHIEDAAQTNGMDIAIVFNSLDHILITDNSDPIGSSEDGSRKSNFIIEDLDGSQTASDLGIVADIGGDNIHGEQIWFMETVGDLMNLVNNHWENNGNVNMAIAADGSGLQLTDPTEVAGSVTVAIPVENSDSKVAEDLGLLTLDGDGNGRALLAGLNTVMLRSLNGGYGGDPDDLNYGANRITEGGSIDLTDRDGNNTTVDLADALTLQDVIVAINEAGTNINARINDNGTGITLEDNTSSGSGNLIVADTGAGTLAEKLGITVNDAVDSIDSGNLQLQYVSEATALDDLRQGRGINRGSFTISDGLGQSREIDLFDDNVKTLGDVIDKINTGGTGIRAAVNDTGDGLLLYDTSVGAGLLTMKVTEGDGRTARDLGLLADPELDTNGRYTVDGSYEFKLEVGGGDGIEEIAQKINDADIGINAALIHDGSNYRLNFNSEISGRQGMIYMDAGTTDFKSETLSLGRDAIVFMGDGSDEHPLLIRSDTNTVKDAVRGTTLELKQVSDEAVRLTIEDDIDTIVSQVSSFVESYNLLMGRLNDVTQFNPDTLERGMLFGDSTVNTIQSTIRNFSFHTVAGVQTYNRLASIGVTMNYSGSNKLDFSEQTFRDAFADDPHAVAELFTKADTGLGDFIADTLDRLAGEEESTIENRLDAVESRHKLFDRRIEDLNRLLESKEQQLYKQYYAMESALAGLQSQQSALAGLASAIPAG